MAGVGVERQPSTTSKNSKGVRFQFESVSEDAEGSRNLDPIITSDGREIRRDRPGNPMTVIMSGDQSEAKSRRSETSQVTTLARKPLTRTQKWFLSTRCAAYIELIVGTALGAITLFMQSHDGLNREIFGEDWERGWLWWLVAVPFYVFSAIYFARFVGSFLFRIWIWEVVNSPWVHSAVITLLSGVLQHEYVDELLMRAMGKPAVVEAIADLVSNVISSDEVQGASVDTVVGALLSSQVQNAIIKSAGSLLQNKALVRAIAALLGSEAFSGPVAMLLVRIIQNEEVGSATIIFVQRLLDNPDVSDVLKRRAASVAGDAQIFVAGRKGFCDSFLGPAPPLSSLGEEGQIEPGCTENPCRAAPC